MSAPPSLLRAAYFACNESERKKFDSLDTLKVEMEDCCWSLFEIMKLYTQLSGDKKSPIRQNLFSKLSRRYEKTFKTNINNKFKKVCTEAVLHNHIECLKLAHEIGVGWGDEMACPVAAKMGNLNCLAYAKTNGCRWDKFTCMFASSWGQLDCLKYAHENRCPWDASVCALAVQSGHLECLKYARDNDCPWTSDVYMSALNSSDPEFRRYARESGCPRPWRT